MGSMGVVVESGAGLLAAGSSLVGGSWVLAEVSGGVQPSDVVEIIRQGGLLIVGLAGLAIITIALWKFMGRELMRMVSGMFDRSAEIAGSAAETTRTQLEVARTNQAVAAAHNEVAAKLLVVAERFRELRVMDKE